MATKPAPIARAREFSPLPTNPHYHPGPAREWMGLWWIDADHYLALVTHYRACGLEPRA